MLPRPATTHCRPSDDPAAPPIGGRVVVFQATARCVIVSQTAVSLWFWAPRRYEVRQGRHLPWLDWARFLAAFMVLVVHARGNSFVAFGDLPGSQHTAVIGAFYAFTRLGTEAVMVFFVLSGFLVGGAVIERAAAGTFSAGSYAANRIIRLYLPLVPALVLTAIVGLAIGSLVPISEIAGNFASLQGIVVSAPQLNGPLWSLSYEFWFYALAGLVAVAYQKKSPLAFLAAGAVLSLFTILDSVHLLAWCIGAIAWVSRPKRLSFAFIAIGLILLAAGIVGTQLGTETHAFSGLENYAASKHFSEIVLSCGMALLFQQIILIDPAERFQSFDRAGTALAAFSYSLYLVHYPLLMAMPSLGYGQAGEISAHSFGVFVTKIAACLGIAWLIWLISERHTDAVRRTVSCSRTPHAASTISSPAPSRFR